MNDLKLIVRTADRARKAEIELPPQMTGGDVIQAAVEKWSLPRDTDYSSVIESDVPIVVQHTRLDSRQAESALLSTIAFAGPD